MAEVSHFRDLLVWQRGMDIVETVYRMTGEFPKSELYGLTGQVRRAAVSVPCNIAEWHARASTKEYLNHISIAQGSVAEVQTQLEIACRLGYISSAELKPVLEQTAILSKQLHALRDALLRRE
jgi:four helix bundle protein